MDKETCHKIDVTLGHFVLVLLRLFYLQESFFRTVWFKLLDQNNNNAAYIMGVSIYILLTLAD